MARILIIEDDAQVRVILRKILERAGYEVEPAPDGKAGIESYRERRADLVITDIIMPEKEGLETIMELRLEFPDVKIVAMSGGGAIGPEYYLKTAKALGALRTLRKPIERDDLLKAVRDVIG